MILPDHEILKLIKEGRLAVEPLADPEMQIQPSGVDLTLGNEFRVFKTTSKPFIDTKADTEDYTELVRKEDEEPFILHPGGFVLAKVREYIKLPDDLVGSLDGRSSLGRLGIVVHTTSSSVNPGWEGNLVLEMTNVGMMPVAVYPGMRVCKISFHKMTSAAARPYGARHGKYQKQTTVTESRMREDKELLKSLPLENFAQKAPKKKTKM